MAEKTDTMSSEAVIAAIQKRHAERKPLAWLLVQRSDPELVTSAERHFRIWGRAVLAAGITYDELFQGSQEFFVNAFRL